jgi:hypothetical protein
MAHVGNAYFDTKGQYFKTPEDATASDLAVVLGRIGEGESLAPGIAMILIERRKDIESIFAQHDMMVRRREETSESDNITPFSAHAKRES